MIIRFRMPNTEIITPTPMMVLPVPPSSASIASMAGALLAASPSTPSA